MEVPYKQLLIFLLRTVFLCGFSLLGLELRAQETTILTRLSIDLKDKSMAEILEEIGDKSGLSMTYSLEDLPVKTFRKKFRRKSVEEILEFIFLGSYLEFTLERKHLIVYRPAKVIAEISESFYSISGFVRDASTGEALIGSTITARPSGNGCVSNDYGFYSLTISNNVDELNVRYLGYQDTSVIIDLNSDIQLDLNLFPLKNILPEVVVKAIPYESDRFGSGKSDMDVSVETVGETASFFGERDVLRTIELLPGIMSTGEGSGTYSVRGGSSDQNLILLDEAPVYHSSHFLGVFSVFNPDALRHVKVIKGDIPTEYRGRLASVLDIHMKEGNINKLGGSGGIGLLASRFMLEGPVFDDAGTFMIAGRRSYLDLIIKALAGDLFSKNGLYFSDLNAKANFRIGQFDRIFGSIYLGKDLFRLEENADISWGNRTATIRWNHLFNEKLFLNTSFIYSDFDFTSFTDIVNVVENLNDPLFDIQTRVRDYHLKGTFNYYPNPQNTFKFGGSINYHRFVPGRVLSVESETGMDVNPSRQSDKYALETSTYFSYQWKSNEWSVVSGLHFSNFAMLGADAFVYQYGSKGEITDSTFYLKGKTIGSYYGVEPRVSISYEMDAKRYLKASYNRTIQYLQRIESAFINNPAAMWLPSTPHIKPQKADQFTLGYYQQLGYWNFTAEIFYKKMQNQIAYRNGAQLGVEHDVESQLVFGRSRSLGLELLLRKRTGRFRGWIGYTLSKSQNKFDGINDFDWYFKDNDRTHDLAIVTMYDLTKKCVIATNWVFFTGKPYTLPDGKYEIDEQTVDFYSERNAYRMKNYHRMDLSFTWFKNGINREGSSFVLSFYNLYAHQNPFLVYFDNNEIRQISLFTFVPSFTWNFDF